MQSDYPTLHHEELDVYKTAIEFFAQAATVVQRLPRGYGSMAEQLRKASLSIPLNIAEGYGWNNVCLVCHSSTDADGYDPDGATGDYAPRNGADVDENHYGPDHAAAGGSGGQFCWDCHDPHGDRDGGGIGNILMVQRATSKTNDNVFGIPVTTATPTFLNNVAPGDFASQDPGPYTGLCNVCHTNLDHNNRASGPTNEHFSGNRCTQCHPHGELTE